MTSPELAVTCPKCGALPGYRCMSVIDPAEYMDAPPYRFHKKRRTALILGSPSTSFHVPVRVAALKRAAVGLVDSQLRTLP